MPTLANSWTALAALALVLGMKHGMDADHLATIDGLTRFNAARPRRARWCGTFFSLGHGAVVIGVVVGVGAAARAWQVPRALEAVGAWTSIGFLTALGLANLHAVLAAGPDAMVHPLGLKAGAFARLQRIENPLAMALVGALFAISFDTVSQAGLIAVAATQFGGFVPALAFASLFTLGMLLVDGLNGLWVARLLARHGAGDRDAVARARRLGRVAAGFAAPRCLGRGQGARFRCGDGARHRSDVLARDDAAPPFDARQTGCSWRVLWCASWPRNVSCWCSASATPC